MALKFTFLFLNLAKVHIFSPKCTKEGGGSTGLGIIPKKTTTFFLVLPLSHWRIFNLWIYVTGHGNISGKNVVANCRREKCIRQQHFFALNFYNVSQGRKKFLLHFLNPPKYQFLFLGFSLAFFLFPNFFLIPDIPRILD